MSVLLLQAVSPVHVGDGTAVGSIDRPVLRERHTGWPTLPGSSLKGAARARATSSGAASTEIEQVFGPDQPGEGAAWRGAVRFGPALLLALPVRAVQGGFLLLTCPLALARFARAADLALPIPTPGPEVALLPTRSVDCVVQTRGVGTEGVVLLEDLAWPVRREAQLDAWVTALGRWLDRAAPLEHLCLVSDDVFTHAATTWLHVRSRTALDRATGVVDKGKLYTTECAPVETLWWGQVDLLSASDLDPWTLLPAPGEVWTVGGGGALGQGRIAWYRRDA